MQVPFLQAHTKTYKIIALFALFAGACVIFYLFNPGQHSFFLPCPFKYITGYNCPGCGSQRALHQLAHGNLRTAFSLNPLLILTLPLIIYTLGLKIWNYIYETAYRVRIFYSNLFIFSYFAVAILYWIFRNLPMYPFAK